MAFDPQALLTAPPIVSRQSVTPKDVMLYALGVGEEGLDFVYEDGLQALPMLAATLAYPGFIWRDPAMGVDWKRVLHGGVSVTLHAPLPVSAELVGSTVIDAIFDKGPSKGAVAYQTREIRDEADRLIATVRNTSMLRGDGGFGGVSDGQPLIHPTPEGEPDTVVALPTREGQALLYRLASGDLNPLHLVPSIATGAGFPRPILHGLCTYGVAGRALVHALVDGKADRIRQIDARFSSPVFPGETIVTEIWRQGTGAAAFRARVAERDLVVLNNGYVEFS